MKKPCDSDVFCGDNRRCHTGKPLRRFTAVAVTMLFVPLLYSCCSQSNCQKSEVHKAPATLHAELSPPTAVKGMGDTMPAQPEAHEPSSPSAAIRVKLRNP